MLDIIIACGVLILILGAIAYLAWEFVNRRREGRDDDLL